MRRLGQIGLSALMLVVLVDWSSVWVCVHPRTCGDQDHDESVTHAHDHGPFEQSRGKEPGRVEHAAELLGVCDSTRDADLIPPPSKRLVLAFELAPFAPLADAVAAAGGNALSSSPDFRTTGRDTLLMTERWLA
jgi:hypothetical protein